MRFTSKSILMALLLIALTAAMATAQGMQQTTFASLALQAGAKANLAPLNWGALQTSGLRLQLLNLQNNAVLQQRAIQRRQ